MKSVLLKNKLMFVLTSIMLVVPIVNVFVSTYVVYGMESNNCTSIGGDCRDIDCNIDGLVDASIISGGNMGCSQGNKCCLPKLICGPVNTNFPTEVRCLNIEKAKEVALIHQQIENGIKSGIFHQIAIQPTISSRITECVRENQVVNPGQNCCPGLERFGPPPGGNGTTTCIRSLRLYENNPRICQLVSGDCRTSDCNGSGEIDLSKVINNNVCSQGRKCCMPTKVCSSVNNRNLNPIGIGGGGAPAPLPSMRCLDIELVKRTDAFLHNRIVNAINSKPTIPCAKFGQIPAPGQDCCPGLERNFRANGICVGGPSIPPRRPTTTVTPTNSILPTISIKPTIPCAKSGQIPALGQDCCPGLERNFRANGICVGGPSIPPRRPTTTVTNSPFKNLCEIANGQCKNDCNQDEINLTNLNSSCRSGASMKCCVNKNAFYKVSLNQCSYSNGTCKPNNCDRNEINLREFDSSCGRSQNLKCCFLDTSQVVSIPILPKLCAKEGEIANNLPCCAGLYVCPATRRCQDSCGITLPPPRFPVSRTLQ